MKTMNENFVLTDEHVKQYQETGYVVLRNFFTMDMVEFLRGRVNEELETPTDNYQKGFDRLRYDLCAGDETVYDLLALPKFREIMWKLTQKKLFFTQGVGFGLKKNVSKGFTWHIESQSFGFHRYEDYATTLWAALHKVDTKAQRGGMRIVPKNIISGNFMYESIDPAVFRCMKERIANGGIDFDEYVRLRDEPLNSSGIGNLLEYFSFEDDYEPGDVCLFDKEVLHRSVPLGEGPLDVRDAFSLRFIDEDSTYDLDRATMIEIPRDYYGYQGPTKFHLEVCTVDGERIIDSPFFDADREKRCLTPVFKTSAPAKVEEAVEVA